MSQVYATEPATSGKVTLQTSHGPIEIHLWCRECPATTKFFLQLCVDGFFDDLKFHRIVPGFLLQTGLRQLDDDNDQKDSKRMMESYRAAVQADHALERRKLEVHSRLRFNHRGQVAMALGLDDDDSDNDRLQMQFFITLEEAPYLDGKHVLFGTVVGPTIFNALRIGRTEVDQETNQPMDYDHAPRIQSVTVHHDTLFQENNVALVVQPQPPNIVPWKKQQQQSTTAKKKKKRKGKRDANVLSFGDEFDQEPLSRSSKGMHSSHDVVSTTSLSKEVDEQVKEAVVNGAAAEEKDGPVATAAKGQRIRNNTEASTDLELTDVNTAKSGKTVANNTTMRDGNHANEPLVATSKSSTVSEKHNVNTVSHNVVSMTNTTTSSASKTSKVSAVEAMRAKYKRKSFSKNKKQREEDTMTKLLAFQSKVQQTTSDAKKNKRNDDSSSMADDTSLAARMAKRVKQSNSSKSKHDHDQQQQQHASYHGQVLESDEDEAAENAEWLSTRFKCRKHMDHAARGGVSATSISNDRGGDGRHMDDYMVVDEKRGRSQQQRHSGKQHQRHHRHGERGHHKHGQSSSRKQHERRR